MTYKLVFNIPKVTLPHSDAEKLLHPRDDGNYEINYSGHNGVLQGWDYEVATRFHDLYPGSLVGIYVQRPERRRWVRVRPYDGQGEVKFVYDFQDGINEFEGFVYRPRPGWSMPLQEDGRKAFTRTATEIEADLGDGYEVTKILVYDDDGRGNNSPGYGHRFAYSTPDRQLLRDCRYDGYYREEVEYACES